MEYKLFLNGFIWLIDWTLTGSITTGQSEPGSNGNEGVLHILQISRNAASTLDVVYCHTQYTPLFFWWGGMHFQMVQNKFYRNDCIPLKELTSSVNVFIFLALLPWTKCNTQSNFERGNAYLIQNFLSSRTAVKETSLSYYLPIAKRITEGVMSFPRALMLNETQTAYFRIWTRVSNSISYNDKC